MLGGWYQSELAEALTVRINCVFTTCTPKMAIQPLCRYPTPPPAQQRDRQDTQHIHVDTQLLALPMAPAPPSHPTMPPSTAPPTYPTRTSTLAAPSPAAEGCTTTAPHLALPSSASGPADSALVHTHLRSAYLTPTVSCPDQQETVGSGQSARQANRSGTTAPQTRGLSVPCGTWGHPRRGRARA